MAYSDDLAAHVEHEMAVARAALSQPHRDARGRLGRARPRRRGPGHVFEHGAPHAFATYFDALFWTTTQLLTVSSQLPNPERAATKVLDVVLEAWAIIVVASLAATFSDLLHHRTRHRAMKERRAASPSPDVR